MSSVIASKVPASVSVAKVEEFFSFCGKIKSVKQIDQQHDGNSFKIDFVSPKAIGTAVLLDDAELNGVQITVTILNGAATRGTGVPESPVVGTFTGNFKDEPPVYNNLDAPPCTPITSTPTDGSAFATPSGDHKIQYDSNTITHTGDATYDQVTQEEKPKYAIMAQLLSKGYVLSDTVIEKSINADKQGGYSSHILSFLDKFDKKYIGTQDENSFANKVKAQSVGSWNKSGYGDILKQYVDRAASTPYGAKVQGLVESVSKEAFGIHQEAVRLRQLHKPDLPARTSNAISGTNSGSVTPTEDSLGTTSTATQPSAATTAHTASASASAAATAPTAGDALPPLYSEPTPSGTGLGSYPPEKTGAYPPEKTG